jgi:hypothetical protein
MTYPDNNSMRVERINEKNEEVFFDLIKTLSKESKDKNRDWFPYILKNDKKKFDQWYITTFKDEIIAFSCVMKIEGYYRLLSRMYNCIRKKGMIDPVKHNEISPAMLMLKQQLYDYPTENIFISMEYFNRRKLLKELAVKINNLYGGHWKLNDGFYLTCPDFIECYEDSSCWQSTISKLDIQLKYMSTAEYLQKFSKKRKMIEK